MMEIDSEKKLGTWGLTAFYISSVVGVGILVVPGIAYQIAGPASLISWIILILSSIPLAFLFARISMLYPNSGGLIHYIRLMFGKRIGDASGFLLLITMIAGNPIMGIASARYLLHLWQLPATNGMVLAVGFGFMFLSVLFNLLHIKTGSRVQLGILAALIAGLLATVFIAVPHFQLENLTPFAPNGYFSIGAAMVVCFYSFLGWENVSTIAEEVKHPKRTYKKAVLLAVGLVGILYLALTTSVIMVLSYGKSDEYSLVLASLLSEISTPNATYMGTIAAIILMVLCTNAWVLGASRLVTALSRDGVIPAVFTKVSRTTNAPYLSLFLLLAFYGLVLLLLYFGTGTEKELILFANSSFILVYVITFLATYRNLNAGLYRIYSLISIIFCVISMFFIGWMIVISALFMAMYILYHRRKTKHGEKVV
ncbi:amino acid permease [Xylanibacillus composti]|uniref:Amino acid permease n=1 Tax=Xylanibacillus composti TaxID=1572762 RepID=A0A8J4H7L5_9BACL|nr:amino acid permease [Xylanibacillus composti]MDT9727187.1 amino acid permease [Xylanibacillus composti]GIQ71486.1 amino acid permease [Xylanibacillus composti]